MTHASERRMHPRLPLHLSVAKLIDFKCDGVDQTAPAILVDISAGGLCMVCFALPELAKEVTFQLDLPGLVKAKLHGKILRVVQKGETYKVAVQFTELQDKWTHLVDKMVKAYDVCEARLQEGDRRFCHKDCGFFSLCQKDEKKRVFPKLVEAD